PPSRFSGSYLPLSKRNYGSPLSLGLTPHRNPIILRQQDLETERKKGRSDLVLFLFAIQRASYFAGHGCQQNPPHYRIRGIMVSKPSPNFLAVDQFKTCS